MRAARAGESSDAMRADGAVTPSSVKLTGMVKRSSCMA